MPQAAKRRSRESILFYATYTDRKCWLRCPVRQYSFEPQGDRRRRYFRLRRGVVTYDETRYNRGRLVSHGSEGGKARRSGVDDFDCRTRRRREMGGVGFSSVGSLCMVRQNPWEISCFGIAPHLEKVASRSCCHSKG